MVTVEDVALNKSRGLVRSNNYQLFCGTRLARENYHLLSASALA